MIKPDTPLTTTAPIATSDLASGAGAGFSWQRFDLIVDDVAGVAEPLDRLSACQADDCSSTTSGLCKRLATAGHRESLRRVGLGHGGLLC